MSDHRVQLEWRPRADDDFAAGEYQREHRWRFSGGLEIEGTAAPDYGGSEKLPNPEEALVAAVASCHLLTFLAIAQRRGLIVAAYDCEGVGTLGKNDDGRMAVTRIRLVPRIEFAGETPDAAALEKLHASAHRNCFIANSISCPVDIEA